MKIAVIGFGNIGGTLARKWDKAGHEVMLGARDTTSSRVQALQKDVGQRASVGSVDQAILFGEVVLFAIPGSAMSGAVGSHGAALNGKVVIDATNALGAKVMNSVEAIKQVAPAANIFRAFNSLPWETYADPEIHGARAHLLYCGPPSGRDSVEQLIRDTGLNPVYVGDLQWAGAVDALAGLSFALSQRVGRRLAFNLVAA